MKTLLLAVAMLVATSAYGQEHAPTVDQCRADVRLWSHQNKTDIEALTIDELNTRGFEMWNCTPVDTGTGESLAEYQRDMDNYRLMVQAYHGNMEKRLAHFLSRHHLWEQFKEEESAGAR